MITITNGTTSATADLVTTARLQRATGRTAVQDLVQVGPRGPLSGTLVFLASTEAAALALDSVYTDADHPVVTIDAPGEPLDDLQHAAVDILRIDTERTMEGVPCRWAVTVEFQEVTP